MRRSPGSTRHIPPSLALAGFLIMLLSACANSGMQETLPAVQRPGQTVIGPLAEVESWAYQLQNINLSELAVSDITLIVIDYADDAGQPFAASEIARLRDSGKVVLSYLSIGEAETYRSYWNPTWIQGDDECSAEPSEAAPSWLGPVNPDWCGNYSVRFWLPEWQAIIMDHLDKILAAGFDGVYLDKVDIFYYWLGEEDLGAPSINEQAPAQMADFVSQIAARARTVDPNFVVVPQNAVEIVEYLDEPQRGTYLEIIDGIAIEDTFFFPTSSETSENAPYNPQEDVLDLLAKYYQPAELPILSVDYVTQPNKVARYYEEATERGFIPYATVRALDRLMPPYTHDRPGE